MCKHDFQEYTGAPHEPIQEVSAICLEFERQIFDSGFATSGCNGR